MSISRNTGYNLVGTAVPLAVTLVTVPLFLSVIGAERYGLLTLCWILLGYVGFLDLGLGPAMAQRIAAMREGPDSEIRALAWTGIWISFAAGLVGALVIGVGVQYYFVRFANIGDTLLAEIAEAVPLLAAIVPVALMAGVLSGILQGRERFLAINGVVVTGSTLMAVVPLALAYLVAPTMPVLIAGAIGARLFAVLLQFFLLRRTLGLPVPARPSARFVKPLLTFGGWVTLIVAAHPFLMTVDRLTIGAMIGAAAVAVYSIPYGLVIRLSAIATSLGGALYPRFAAVGPDEAARLQREGLTVLAVIMTPVILGFLLLLDPFLRLWIGETMAVQSAPIGAVLAFGIWANALAQMPYMFLQGSGRPKLPAKLLLAEILPYWLVLGLGIWAFGVLGAALAWAARATADAILLGWLGGQGSGLARFLALPALLVLAGAGTAVLGEGMARHGALLLLLCMGALWSIRNMPASLHGRLGRLRAYLPRPRAGSVS